MKQIACEMCGSSDLIKVDGFFVCQHCGMKYTVEEAKKLMIEGVVKIDNSSFVQKYLANAHRAYAKDDWEEVEKYYNMVEENSENNIEAVFFSSFGKAMQLMCTDDYYQREAKFEILVKSISVINDYYEVTTEDKHEVLTKICEALEKIKSVGFIYKYNSDGTTFTGVGSKTWLNKLIVNVFEAYLIELGQILAAHPEEDAFITELKTRVNSEKARYLPAPKKGGCYVATAVYGSYDCPQVWTLRRFRDYDLAATWYGRAFIRTYYAISPTLVKWFGETKWFKKMWRGTLDRMVTNLQKKGYESTPYQDKNW